MNHHRLKSNGAMIYILSILLLCSLPSNGQITNDVDLDLTTNDQLISPVKIDGRNLFYIRGITSYSSEQRAATISKRIKNAASNKTISIDSVKIINGPDHLMIYAGKEFIMNVYDADAEIEKVSQMNLATHFRTKIAEAIELYRDQRSRPVLIKKSIYALGSIILYILLLIGILWLIQKTKNWLQTVIKDRADSLENKSFNLISSIQIWSVYNTIFRISKFLAVTILTIISLEYIFGLYPWTNNIVLATMNLIVNPLTTLGKGILAFIPNLFFLMVIFFVTRYLLKLIRLLFNGINNGVIELQDFSPEWAIPTFRIFRIFIIAFAVIIAYPYIPGSSSAAFKGVSVFLGLLLSLGSSSLIGNIISGYSMTYRKAFKKGDCIQFNDIIGFVEEQKLMVTRLRSYKNEEIIIPNSNLQNSNIINYSSKAKEKGLILHTIVGIGYETPWRQVDSMLKLAADRTCGLLKHPPPFVLKKSLGDFAISYEINAFCEDVINMNIYYSELHQNILDVFNENDVQIMTPAYESDPEDPKIVARDKWNLPLAKED